MIDLSTDDGVRAALKEIASWDAPPVDEGATVRAVGGAAMHHSARRRTLLAVAAAVVLMMVATVAVVGRGTHESGLPAGSWSGMSTFPLPARLAPSVVWTGTQMVVFGGFDRNGTRRVDGAAYSPTTNTWRTIADMPRGAGGTLADPATPDLAVWTGSEVVAVAGNFRSSEQKWDLVSYDPNTNAWRVLDENRYEQLPTDALRHLSGDAPLDSPRSMVAWHGKVAVYGWDSATQRVGWTLFDPVADEWSPFHGVPFTTDQYLLGGGPGSWVLLGDRYFVQLSRGTNGDNGVGGLVMDLEASTERVLHYPPGVTVRTGYDMMIDAAGLAVGLIYHDDLDRTTERRAFVLDPQTGNWTPSARPPGPLDGRYFASNRPALLAVPRGHLLLGGLDGHVAAVANTFASSWNRWRGLPIDPARVGHTMIWTGHEVIVWGGAAVDPAGSQNAPAIPLSDGAVYEYRE